MKNEKKKMMQYINQLDDKKLKKAERASKTITITLSTIIFIITAIIIFFFSIIASFFYNEIYLVFSLGKEQFVKKLEIKYNQKIEILNANCDEYGNGTYILKTQKEPKIEFYAVKGLYNNFETDYEDRMLIYYIENEKNPLFKNIKLTKQEEVSSYYKNFKLLRCKTYFPIEKYEQIDEASKNLYQIQEFMEKNTNEFSTLTYLKIGEYISPVKYNTINSPENGIYQEKYEYYWYLINSKGDTKAIPKNDIEKLKYPRQLDVYANENRVIDMDNSGYGMIFYLTANYNLEKQTYEVDARKMIINNLSYFKMLSNNNHKDFKFTYKNKKYGVSFRNDDTIIGNNLPWISEISYFTELLGVEIKYDLDAKIVNFIL